MSLVPSCSQDDFEIAKLEEVNAYEGLTTFDYEVDFKDLFGLF
jgi:hypothetical protein